MTLKEHLLAWLGVKPEPRPFTWADLRMGDVLHYLGNHRLGGKPLDPKSYVLTFDAEVISPEAGECATVALSTFCLDDGLLLCLMLNVDLAAEINPNFWSVDRSAEGA